MAMNWDPMAMDDDGSCIYYEGCTDPMAMNWDPMAMVDDGSCESIIEGCLDDLACNYNIDANVDNNSCTYAEQNYDCDGNCLFDLEYISVSSGLWPTEVSWSIANEGEVLISGGAPTALLYCMDPSLCYSIIMEDSFGDGWNESEISIGNESFTLIAGTQTTVEYGECAEQVCEYTELFVDVIGADPTSDFSFIVSGNDNSTAVIGDSEFNGTGCFDLENNCYTVTISSPSGSGPLSGTLVIGDDSFDWAGGEAPNLEGVIWTSIYYNAIGDNCNSYGCTDETACNYDSSFTINDGSCTYPENGFDCEGSCIWPETTISYSWGGLIKLKTHG